MPHIAKMQQIIEWRRAKVMELLSKGENNQQPLRNEVLFFLPAPERKGGVGEAYIYINFYSS
jgi:hypothetical protein